tara:strand:- start:64 stop:1200 length:1137 start_codon:yes stop_codon:yes gene_type:complete
LYYLLFNILLIPGWLCIILLIGFSPLLKIRRKSYDLALYPYSQKGGDGYQRRFVEYFEYLEKDNISFKTFDVCYEDDFRIAEKKGSVNLYFFLLKNYYIRIGQTMKIRHFKKAFVQRGLVPYFFLRKEALLERLAAKLCDMVVYDYWDAVWVGNPIYAEKTARLAHKVTVVNTYLENKFKKWNKQTLNFPIAINLNHYAQKTNYNLINEGTLNLIYTGQVSHASDMIRILEENVNFSKLSFKIKLTLICREDLKSKYFEIENLPFDLQKMSSRMIASDLGIYAVDDNEYNHGKLAMKSLEYASCQLPQISSPIGLSPAFEKSKDFVSLDTKSNWNIILENLYDDAEKRKTISGQSFIKVRENHSIIASYEAFKIIMEF